MVWEKVESEVHNFLENKEFVGKLKEKVESQFEGMNYVFENDEGKNILVFGKTALSTKMNRVKVGEKVKIVYLGEKKSNKSGAIYHDFEVFIDK